MSEATTAPMAAQESDDVSVHPRSEDNCKFCIRGWRKWCIFLLLLLLVCMVVANLALTLWIMAVMRFNTDGMGPMKITSDGVRLTGGALFTDRLAASTIRSLNGEPISIYSYDNFTVATYGDEGLVDNRLFVDGDVFECAAKHFLINDPEGNLLFSANGDEVVLGADTFRIIGEGGVIFDGSISTPHVRSDPGEHLTLESSTSSVFIESAQKIDLKTDSINAKSFNNIKLQSRTGALVLDSSRIEFKYLERAVPSSGLYRDRPKKFKSKIYQLCVCNNGRIFMANPDGVCQTYDSDYICA